MFKFTRRQLLFLFLYPFVHGGVILLCFVVSELFMHSHSMLSEVIFMFVLLLIAPVLAFPRSLEEINHVFSGWPAPAVLLLVYAVILVVYALPLLLLYKRSRKR